MSKRMGGMWIMAAITMFACVGSGVSSQVNNPMTENLDANGFDILNVGGLEAAQVMAGDLLAAGPWLDARLYGATNAAAIAAAIDDVDSAEATVLLAPGVWNINTSVTVPANVNLRFERGAILDVASGVTFTIAGGLEAPLGQLFTGDGSVVLQSDRIANVYPQWWGASSAASAADNTFAFQEAMDSGYRVQIPSGTYALYELYAVGGPALIMSGTGRDTTILQYQGTTNFLTIGIGTFSGHYVKDLKIVGNANAVNGLRLGRIGGSGHLGQATFENLDVSGFTTTSSSGLYGENLYNCRIVACNFTNCYFCVYLGKTAMNNEIVGCQLSSWLRGGAIIVGTSAEPSFANVIRGCRIGPSPDANCYGILTYYANVSVIEGNYFNQAGGIAVWIANNYNNTVRDNLFYGSSTSLWISATDTLVMNNQYLSGTIVDSGTRSAFLFDAPSLGNGGTSSSRLAWGRQSGVDGWLSQDAGLGIYLGGRKILGCGAFVANGIQEVTNPGVALLATNEIIRVSSTSQKYLDGVAWSAGCTPGRKITIYFNDSYTQVRHGMSGSCNGYFRLAGGVPWTPGSNDCMRFLCIHDGTWLEIGRANN